MPPASCGVAATASSAMPTVDEYREASLSWIGAALEDVAANAVSDDVARWYARRAARSTRPGIEVCLYEWSIGRSRHDRMS